MNRLATVIDVSMSAFSIVGQTIIEVVVSMAMKVLNGKVNDHGRYKYSKPIVVLTNTER